MKKCPKCCLTKPHADFNKSAKRNDGLQIYCRLCSKEQSKSHYDKNKPYYYSKVQKDRQRNKEYVKAARNKPCTDCGVNYPWYIMDFDHLESSTKVIDVCSMVNRAYSIENIQKEIDKCELVCANCHRARTYRRAPWGVEELVDSSDFESDVL